VADDAKVRLLAALVEWLPWLLDMLAPSVKRRVRDILPERSASAQAAERIRRGGR